MLTDKNKLSRTEKDFSKQLFKRLFHMLHLLNSDRRGVFRTRRMFFLSFVSCMFILSASAVHLLSCGSITENQNGPALQPLEFLSGTVRGNRVVRDRNGNVRATAQITRNCKLISELSGECEDAIKYYGIDSPAMESFKFSITYDEKLKLHMKMQGDAGLLEGRALGPVVHLTGKLAIPLEKNIILSVETRWDSLSIDSNTISMQKDTYYQFGISSGTVETIWQK